MHMQHVKRQREPTNERKYDALFCLYCVFVMQYGVRTGHVFREHEHVSAKTEYK